jgi:1,4-alpha-glucan branching enzyme
MTEIARHRCKTCDPAIERTLKQAARELLLAQASDWAFLIKTNSAPDYARRRTEDHLLNFNRLYQQLDSGQIDFSFLEKREARANLFPNLNWRYYL